MKKTKKKSSKLLLVLMTILLTMVCGNAFAAPDFSQEDIVFADANVKALCVANWDTDGDGELSYDEAAAVTTISVYFKNNNTITSFDEFAYFTGLTSIGNNAFEGCSGLTSIIIPNSITSIGQNAFSGCSGMTSIDIPNSVTSIGSNAFHNCVGLTSFRFPNRLETISANVLSDCHVTSIIIPGSVKTIEQGAFVSCQQLQDVYCLASEVPTTNSLTFYNLNKNNVTLHVYSESVSTYSSASVWNTLKEVVALTSDEIEAIAEAYDPNAIKVGDLYYHIDVNNNIAAVTSFRYVGNIVIPTTISWENSDFDVTCIGEYAFEGCTGLTSINIPNSVTSIEEYAFQGCSGLTSVIIPNSVTSIRRYAFSGCSGLTSVTIGSGLTSIGPYVFNGCSNLTSVTLNSNFSVGLEKKTNFGTQVTEYIIGDGVTIIDSQAFYNCSGLTSVTIPNSVTSIGYQAFYKCSGLTSVTIPNSVTSIGNQAFYNCSGLTSITIPNGVTSIGNSAFYGCPDLTSVTIPNSVTSIGESAFGGCSGLTKVIVSNIAAWCGISFVGGGNANPLSSAHHLYSDENTEITDLVIPDGVTSISPCSFWSCTGLESVTIPNSVTSIGGNAFTYCSNLTSLTLNSNAIASQSADIGNIFGGAPITELIIGEDVTNIGNNAFSGYSGLTSVTIGSGVTSIGDYAFNGCTGLTSVEIPNSVTSIGGGAFRSCSGLTSVTIPNSVTSIDSWAFHDCSSLTSVTVDINTPLVISWTTFYNCANATLYVPAGCKAAYEAADYWKDFNEIIEMAAPTNIVFADANVKALCVANWDTDGDGELSYDEAEAVTSLSVVVDDNSVFWKNTSITSFDELQYFTGLTSIAVCAFEGCSSLTSITIPNSVTNIKFEAFKNCSSLTTIEIPSGVTSIEVFAFEGCSSLETISVEVENTKYDSRNNCNAIIEKSSNSLLAGCKNTVIPNDVTSIANGAFSGCSGLTSISIPNNVTSIGQYAFESCSGLTSVTIPTSVTSIDDVAFYNCSGLEAISVEAGNTIYDSRNNCNAIIITATNGLLLGCKNTVIPNSVTYIGWQAFAGCVGLTSITIPNSVTSIGWGAFQGSGLTSITIPSSVTSIDFCAFNVCSGLTSVTIPNSVTSIGNEAFNGCSSLTSVISKIETPFAFGSNAFKNVSSTCVLTVPEGTRDAYIAAGWTESVFKGGVVEESDDIIVFADANVKALCVANWDTDGDGELSYDEAEAVTSIGTVFRNNTSITSFDELQYFTGLTSIGSEAFYHCSGLTSVTIPNSVTTIENHAFTGCSGLTSITIPRSVNMLEGSPFSACTNLETIIVEEGNTSFDSRDNCNAIIDKSVNRLILGCKNTIIPNSITSIGMSSFFNCPGLTSITIPGNVNRIGDYAFSSCSGLTTITISNGVTSIGRFAFENCSSLTSIKSKIETPFAFEEYAFDNIPNTCVLTVPKGTRDAYIAAGWTEDVFKGGVVEDENITIAMKTGSGADRTMIGYSSQYNLDFTGINDVKAYIAIAFSDTRNVYMARVYVVPANTGIVLKSDVAGVEVEVPTTTSDMYYANLLKPAVNNVTIYPTQDIDAVNYTNLMVGKLANEQMGFVTLPSSKAYSNKCYLQVPTEFYNGAASAREGGLEMEFVDTEITDIRSLMHNGSATNDAYYDLQGRKVIPGKKGIYIKNGKKVIVK